MLKPTAFLVITAQISFLISYVVQRNTYHHIVISANAHLHHPIVEQAQGLPEGVVVFWRNLSSDLTPQPFASSASSTDENRPAYFCPSCSAFE
jgi:hypothetical protein